MKRFILTLLVGVIALVLGCGVKLPERPERRDTFASLTATNPTYKDLTLGLILSDNTKNAMQYTKEWHAPHRTDSANAQFVDNLAAVFQRNFKAVRKIEKFEEASTVNADLVAVLDVYPRFTSVPFQDTKIDVSVALLSIDNKQIDMVQATSVGIASWDRTPLEVVIGASNEAIQKLETALRGSMKLAEFSKSKAGASTTFAAKSQATTPAPTIQASDVDTLPSVIKRPKKNAYAVVIGIEQYREKLPKADFADRDAKLMGEYLTRVLGYPEENVVVRLNERATRTDLVKYFEEWLKNNVEPGGSVFIYYSGHGSPNTKTGEAYLVPYDGDPSFVDSTAYPLKQMYAALEKLPAKDITVVLDSCFSGAGGRSVLAKGARPMVLSMENPMLAFGKTVVLAASGGDQISNSYDEKGHGLLTYYFLKGLQGEGDANKDGVIEMAELFEYVKPNVQRIARKQYNNEQTPQLLASPDVLKKGGGRLVERSAP